MKGWPIVGVAKAISRCVHLTCKGKLRCCKIGEHTVDTKGFPPCWTTPNRLSLWEKVGIKRQIDALVSFGKMKFDTFEYARRVTLLIKKHGSCHFCEND